MVSTLDKASLAVHPVVHSNTMLPASLHSINSSCQHSHVFTAQQHTRQHVYAPRARLSLPGAFRQSSLLNLQTWRGSPPCKVCMGSYLTLAETTGQQIRLCQQSHSMHAVQGMRCRRSSAVRAAMFDDLSRNLEKAWDMVRKDGKLTKDNVKEPMREIRRALLEADVCLHCSP